MSLNILSISYLLCRLDKAEEDTTYTSTSCMKCTHLCFFENWPGVVVVQVEGGKEGVVLFPGFENLRKSFNSSFDLVSILPLAGASIGSAAKCARIEPWKAPKISRKLSSRYVCFTNSGTTAATATTQNLLACFVWLWSLQIYAEANPWTEMDRSAAFMPWVDAKFIFCHGAMNNLFSCSDFFFWRNFVTSVFHLLQCLGSKPVGALGAGTPMVRTSNFEVFPGSLFDLNRLFRTWGKSTWEVPKVR